jgi:FG-GAP-like repeat/ASPIC and UnbV
MTVVLGSGIWPALVSPDKAEAVSAYWFSNQSDSWGLTTKFVRSYGSVLVDIDRNGQPDLFVNRHWNPATLYANRDGHMYPFQEDFQELPGYRRKSRPGKMDRHDCAWGEANGRGRPELYCSQGADMGRGSGPNQLLFRTGHGFVDRARRFGVKDPLGRGRSVNWLDYDGDGDLDIYLTNMLRTGHPSVAFRNDRGLFRRVRIGLGVSIGGWPAATWADWDRDGDPDILIGRHNRNMPRAFENQDGHYVEVSLPNVTDQEWVSAAWGDFDGDGFPDVALVHEDRVAIMRNVGAGFVPVFEEQLEMGRMASWLDVDNDGDLDAFLVQGNPGSKPASGHDNEPDMLLVQDAGSFAPITNSSIRGPVAGNGDAATIGDVDSDGSLDVFVSNGHNPSVWRGPGTLLVNESAAGNWVKLRLNGTRWNPWGYGARVEVIAGTLAYQRQLNDGVTYRSQSDVSQIHLGIGIATAAMVTVQWPDGRIDCVQLQASETRSLKIGSSPCL